MAMRPRPRPVTFGLLHLGYNFSCNLVKCKHIASILGDTSYGTLGKGLLVIYIYIYIYCHVYHSCVVL
jgi:hypothetical protein